MDDPRILIFNHSSEALASNREYQQTLAYLKKQFPQTVSEVACPKICKARLASADVLIVWIDAKESDDWHELDEFMDNSDEIYYVGFIIILASPEIDIFKNAKETFLRRIYTFTCPLALDILKAFIDGLASKMKYEKSLVELEDKLLKAQSLESIITQALYQLENHPLVGYNRASIALVDPKTETLKRYLLKLDPPEIRPDRHLQRDIKPDPVLLGFWRQWYRTIQILHSTYLTVVFIELISLDKNAELGLWSWKWYVSMRAIKETYLTISFCKFISMVNGDKLIMNVLKETVFIIEDLDELRKTESQSKLAEFGWSDHEVATQDINSWIGLAAKHQGQTVAVITLDHIHPGQYKKLDHQLKDFLKDFGEIFADAIDNFFVNRNEQVIKKIISNIGDQLTSKELVQRICTKLKVDLDCDSCNYFAVAYDTDSKDLFLFLKELEEWQFLMNEHSQTLSQKAHTFPKGVGIVGAVLETGKSRIVPHAFEDEKFIPTLKHPGNNLSMLAVPVSPLLETVSHRFKRVIGIICCYKHQVDYFTIYDRDLLEEVALATATILERTMTLEFSHEISSTMLELVDGSGKVEGLLERICHHALKVTNAGSVSIHLLKQKEELGQNQAQYVLDRNREGKPIYYTFPKDTEDSPRLDGRGTTDLVIEKRCAIEFSKDNDFERVSEKQRETLKYKLVVPLIVTKGQQPSLVGALYLNKYIDEPFSKVEKFAVDLFANQAATIIDNQRILSINQFNANAHQKLTEAIKKVASTDNVDLLLQIVADQSRSLVDATLSYVVIGGNNQDFEIKAASPHAILREFKQPREACATGKRGITGLAARDRKPFIVFDIQEEISRQSEKGKEYIEFRKETRSELAVPIIDEKSKLVLGVINLEHDDPHFFTEQLHINVIQQFASQVAIAFQKKSYTDQIQRSNKILQGLHRSLAKIVTESPQEMLYRAVSQTREFLDAEAVIVIPINKQKRIQNKDIIPGSIDPKLIRILQDKSIHVYKKSQDNENFADCSEKSQDDKNFADCLENSQDGENLADSSLSAEELEKIRNRCKSANNIHSGLCIPFAAGSHLIGVVWILFSKRNHDNPLEHTEIYTLYANQIALAYDNARQFEKLKNRQQEDLSKEINRDYRSVRLEASIYFLISLVSSLAGLYLIFTGVNAMLLSESTKQGEILNQNGETLAKEMPEAESTKQISDRANTAWIGILLQGVTVLAFQQGRRAHDRSDRYHQELYNTGKLSILLSATEQLDPEIIHEEKRQIIQATTRAWLTNNSDKPVSTPAEQKPQPDTKKI